MPAKSTLMAAPRVCPTAGRTVGAGLREGERTPVQEGGRRLPVDATAVRMRAGSVLLPADAALRTLTGGTHAGPFRPRTPRHPRRRAARRLLLPRARAAPVHAVPRQARRAGGALRARVHREPGGAR